MSKIISVPKSHLIEKTALEFAAVYYEAGRSTGLTSKHKNAKSFARANFEKFVPKVVEHVIEMLGNKSLPELMKQEIYEALMERHNDPTLNDSPLPDLNIKKLDNLIRQYEKNRIVINTSSGQKSVLHNQTKKAQ